MHLTTTERIDAVLAYLMAAYPNWRPTRESVAVFEAELGDIEPADLMAGARDWVRNAEAAFPPSVGQLRTRVRAARVAAQDAEEQRIAEERRRQIAAAEPQRVRQRRSVLDMLRDKGPHWEHVLDERGKDSVVRGAPSLRLAFGNRGPWCSCIECQSDYRDERADLVSRGRV